MILSVVLRNSGICLFLNCEFCNLTGFFWRLNSGSTDLSQSWVKFDPNIHHVLLPKLINPRPAGVFFITRATGGGGYFEPPSDLWNYWTDSKNLSSIWKSWKTCRGKTHFNDLGVTSDVTGQVKVKMFDISGLVISAYNSYFDVKREQSQWIGMDSITDICK